MTMPLKHWTALVELCAALYATGVHPWEISPLVKSELGSYDLPQSAQEWLTLALNLLSGTESWLLAPALLASLIPRHAAIVWKHYFEALGPTFATAEARFTFIYDLIGYHSLHEDREFVKICRSGLIHAGIHPMSLLLCCHPTLQPRHVKKLLRSMGKHEGVLPFSHIDEPWMTEIAGWWWNESKAGGMDGVISGQPVLVSPHPSIRPNDSVRSALGNRMIFGDAVQVRDLYTILTLGNDIHVYGDLHLVRLRGLSFLGKRIQVEGNLIIRGCPNLNDLPGDLQVGGCVAMSPLRPEFHWNDCISVEKRMGRYYIPPPPRFEVPESLERLQELA